MNYEEALEYIHDTRWRGRRRGLARIKQMLEIMGNPQKDLKFVHVAGTNGKGSTTACIASVLKAAGYKTGMYTSPFIARYNERMQINNEQIPDEKLAELVTKLAPIADSLPDHPSEFEFGTAVAFQFFKDENCDVVVLEVGMGGEFDATNSIDESEVSVFTAIGLDHMEYLGPTTADIARTKGGIIKENGTVCSYGTDAPANAEIEKICADKHATLHYADFSKIKNTEFTLDGTTFDYGDRHIKLALPGSYQPYNCVLAMTAIDCLIEKGWKISEENILEGLRTVYWPGRFEILSRSPIFVLDGGHNAHGITAATESLRKLFPDRKMIFCMGVMADKDYDDMLDLMIPLAEEFFTMTPNNTRSLPAEKLAEQIRAKGIKATAYDTIDEGVAAAIREAGTDRIVCAIGSLYYSADVKNAARKALGIE